jgi:hypothetical protein
MVVGNYPGSIEMLLQLREMGFYKVLQIDGHEARYPDGRPAQGRPHFLRFHTLNSVHPQLAATFCEVVSAGAFKMDELTQGRMVAALKEAMLNAHEHAYSKECEYEVMPKRWWLAGYVNPSEGEMMIIILDQGVGIPNTLAPTTFEKISAILKLTPSPSDGNMIAAATELWRTSTGAPGRGRGFGDMKKFVDTCDDGELRILSNRGIYTYIKGQREIKNYRVSLGGTLVEWRVKHGKLVEWIDA